MNPHESNPPTTEGTGMNTTQPVETRHKPVVTIFEAYGAGADEVGQKVADKLGLPFHAQAFSSAQLADEALGNNAILVRVMSTLGGAYGGLESRDIVAAQQDRYDLVAQNNADVRRFADEGGVIVGRNGALILADRPNTLHVLLTGEVEDRVTRAAQQLGITIAQAASRRAKEEDVRREMSRNLYGWDPMTPDRYDMLINTTRVGIDRASDAIVDAVQTRLN